jgi:two-component system, sensor histidine kinase YesM
MGKLISMNELNERVTSLIKKTKAFLKKMSITWRLMLYLSILLSVQMALIGWFSYNWVSMYLKDTYIKKILETNYTIMQQTNYIRSKYEEISDGILANATIQKILHKKYNASLSSQMIQDKDSVEELLSNPNDSTYSMILSKNGIVYQSFSGRYLSASYDSMVHSKIFNYSQASNGSNLWIVSDENIMASDNEPYLYVCRTLKSLEPKTKVLGQLIIQIPIDILDNVFKQSKLDTGEYYAIVNSNGDYLYHTGNINLYGRKADKDILSILNYEKDGYKILKKESNHVILSYSDFSVYGEKGWSVVHVLPMSVILSNARTICNVILLIMIVSLLVSLPILVLLSNTISSPIKKLKSAVEQFGEGNLHVRASTNRMDEVGHLQVSFNKMADDINLLLEKIAFENKQRRLLELNVLEYQINPHFLYNTLDSINWMAQKAGKEDIGELAGALARFFRKGLSRGNEFYKVKDELEHVQQYLLINKIRYKDCFQYQITSDPEVLENHTIKIILQPLVENAIKYGINKKGTYGFISVTVKKDNNSILFEISDNGEGIENNRLKAIQSALEKHITIDGEQADIKNSINTGSGFGLFNVNQRIWLHFGDGFGITIDSFTQNSNVSNENLGGIKPLSILGHWDSNASKENNSNVSGTVVRIRLPIF